MMSQDLTSIRARQAILRGQRLKVLGAILTTLFVIAALGAGLLTWLHYRGTVRAPFGEFDIPASWARELPFAEMGIPDPSPCARGESHQDPRPERCSPDGSHVAYALEVGGAYHTLYISGRNDDDEIPIISVQESDPGSGRSFSFRWTSDSKGLLVHGSGPVRGTDRELPLVFSVDDGAFSEIRIPECTFDIERWQTGDPIERGKALPCLGGWETLYGWSDKRLYSVLGPPDDESRGYSSWYFELDPTAHLYQGRYTMMIGLSRSAGSPHVSDVVFKKWNTP